YRQLHYRHRVFNVKGLETRGEYTLELNQVFVDLRVAPGPGRADPASLDPLRSEVKSGHQSIWEFLASRSTADHSLAILGPPGSGKTTLLQHVALTLAHNRQRRYHRRCRPYVPL